MREADMADLPKTIVMTLKCFVNILITFQMLYSSTATAANTVGLRISYDCACLGDNVLYECTVPDVGATVWRGEAFDCPETNNMIYLSNVIDSTRECNNGDITGSLTSTQPNESLHTSQLTVRVGPDTNGTIIECLHDNGAGNLTEVGSTVLNITTEPFPGPSPNGLQLVKMNPNELVFEWSEVTSNCSLFYYLITSNCSQCPNITRNTTATCTGNFTQTVTCLFVVQSVLCGAVSGMTSTVKVVGNLAREHGSYNNSSESEEGIVNINSASLDSRSILIIISVFASILVLLGILFTLGLAVVCLMMTRKDSHESTTSPKPATIRQQNCNQDNAVDTLLQPTTVSDVEDHNRRVEATVTVIYAEVDDHAGTGVQTLKPLEDDRVQYSEIKRQTELMSDQQQCHGLNHEPVDQSFSGDNEHEYPPELPPRCY